MYSVKRTSASGKALIWYFLSACWKSWSAAALLLGKGASSVLGRGAQAMQTMADSAPMSKKRESRYIISTSCEPRANCQTDEPYTLHEIFSLSKIFWSRIMTPVLELASGWLSKVFCGKADKQTEDTLIGRGDGL
jgi:hypothetical protein